MISGFFGALLLVSKSASKRLGATLASILAGTACANYLTPLVMNLMPESIKMQGKYATAFVMGFMGLKGLELVIDKIFKTEERKSEPASTRKPKKRKGRK